MNKVLSTENVEKSFFFKTQFATAFVSTLLDQSKVESIGKESDTRRGGGEKGGGGGWGREREREREREFEMETVQTEVETETNRQSGGQTESYR